MVTDDLFCLAGERQLFHKNNDCSNLGKLCLVWSLMICFVSQENVSCLNTTLVFLMFANQKNRLPQYLRALSQDRTGSGECSSSCNIMKNFRDLLLFWQDHYLHKDKDCSALEKVSMITRSELGAMMYLCNEYFQKVANSKYEQI